MALGTSFGLSRDRGKSHNPKTIELDSSSRKYSVFCSKCECNTVFSVFQEVGKICITTNAK